jgi:predicted transcriptional regulator
MGEDSIISLIANDNYIIVNKSLIHMLGLHEAIILGELASEYSYYKRNEMLDSEGYFYSTVENVKENTGLSKDIQCKALKKLNTRGLIHSTVKGIPAKRYVKFNYQLLASLLVNITPPSCRKTRQLDIAKTDTNNNNINNNKKNNKNIYYDNVELNDLFLDFLEVRKKLKAVNSERAINSLLKTLSNYDDDTKYKMIENSVTNSWKGIFPLKEQKTSYKPQRVEKVPSWINTNIDESEATEEEQKALEDYLNGTDDFETRRAKLQERLKQKYGKGGQT